MQATEYLNSSVNIFSRYNNKNKRPLKQAVASGQVDNIDYTNYKSFRAVSKDYAVEYFSNLFEQQGDKKKFILKDKVVSRLNEQGVIQFEQKYNDQASIELANKVKVFLDSILTFQLDGKVNLTEALPLFKLESPYKNYFLSSRSKTHEALIKRYKDGYGVLLDVKQFTCPLSESVAHKHNGGVQIEHIENEKIVFQKLLAGIYILNKLKPVDEKDCLGDKFYNLELNFRVDPQTNPDLKQTKQFLFAKKSLVVNLLSDIRNLVFICAKCNKSKPKNSGWSVAIDSDPFKTVVDDALKNDMKTEANKLYGEIGIIDFNITQRFQSAIINRFKARQSQQELIDTRRNLEQLAISRGVSFDELMEQIKTTQLETS